MRMSAKAEYAVRAMVELACASDGKWVAADALAAAQAIPLPFLVDILAELRSSGLVRGKRGRDGGYALTRPASTITVADVLGCIDGPLMSVGNVDPNDLPYFGATAALADVWMALRASMRQVLEGASLADVAANALPEHVRGLSFERP
jgi:Rrf2 family protein